MGDADFEGLDPEDFDDVPQSAWTDEMDDGEGADWDGEGDEYRVPMPGDPDYKRGKQKHISFRQFTRYTMYYRRGRMWHWLWTRRGLAEQYTIQYAL